MLNLSELTKEVFRLVRLNHCILHVYRTYLSLDTYSCNRFTGRRYVGSDMNSTVFVFN